MGFAIAEAFVDIGINAESFNKGVADLKGKVSALGSSLSALSGYARAAFVGIVGVLGFAAKAYGEAEHADSRLRAALEATGQEVANNATRLDRFADTLQKVTIFDRDAIKAQMAFATSLGVTADQMSDVTKLGIGLAAAYFGDNLEEGMKAAAEAQQGNFRALQRLIPELKTAKSAQEAMNIVVAKGNIGLKLAESDSDTFNGQLKIVWHTLTDVAKQIGEALVPYLKAAGQWIKATAEYLKGHMTPALAGTIVKFAGVAAVIAGVIAFGPAIIAFGQAIIGVMGAVASALLSVGQMMLWLVTSPIGLILVGLAGIVTAFAYAIGSGDTFVERTGSGFKQIVGFLDTMLGSWEGFTSGFGMLWSQAISFVAEGFTKFKEWLLNGWEYLAEGIEQAFWYAFEGIYKGWEYLKTGAQKFMNWMSNAWDNLIDLIADKFASWMIESDRKEAEKEIRAKGAKKGKSEADIQKEVDDDAKSREQYVRAQQNQRDAAKSSEYAKKQKALDDEYSFKSDYMGKQMNAQRAEDRAKRDGNRKANSDESKQVMDALEADRKRDLAERKAQFDKLPKLSDKAKGLFDSILDKTGLKGLFDMVKGIEDQKANLGKEAADAKAQVGGVGPIKANGANDKKQSVQFTSLEDAFKNSIARQLLGNAAAKDERLKILQEQRDLQKQANEIAKAVAAQLAGLPAAIGGWLGLQ